MRSKCQFQSSMSWDLPLNFVSITYLLNLLNGFYQTPSWRNAQVWAKWVCHFPIGILGQVWYLIVSIPDLCNLTYFKRNIFLCAESMNQLHRHMVKATLHFQGHFILQFSVWSKSLNPLIFILTSLKCPLNETVCSTHQTWGRLHANAIDYNYNYFGISWLLITITFI